MRPSTIQYEPIGFLYSPYDPSTGAPRQGVLRPDVTGTIEVFEPYRRALADLSRFEYIVVVSHLDRITGWTARVRPPESGHEFGLFATRSPRRPNPIGLSVVKLLGIDGCTLLLSGIDAFDGTPVLDIKPYLPSIDSVHSETNEAVERQLGHHDEDFITDPAFFE